MLDENFVYKLMAEHAKMKEALTKIADYDCDIEEGYTDEWTQANGFTFCQNVAEEILKQITE